jgi:hypothetical protein
MTMYLLINVSPTGTMTAQVTYNYRAAEGVILSPGWSAFVVEVLSFQTTQSQPVVTVTTRKE